MLQKVITTRVKGTCYLCGEIVSLHTMIKVQKPQTYGGKHPCLLCQVCWELWLINDKIIETVENADLRNLHGHPLSHHEYTRLLIQQTRQERRREAKSK